MLLSQVEGFLETARQGNLSRAAAALYISQPALTARLRALETELGERLFNRTHRGMELTDAGRAFLPYAERAIGSLEGGRQLVAGIRRGGRRRARHRGRAGDQHVRPAGAARPLRGRPPQHPARRPDRPLRGDRGDGAPRRDRGRSRA